MSETKIKVPDGMLAAAVVAAKSSGAGWNDGNGTIPDILEAALLWQRDNVPVPTDHQAYYLSSLGISRDKRSISPTGIVTVQGLIEEWVRHMYDEPEPKVPEEIKDLLLPNIESGFFKPEVLNERLAESFRRGQKAGPK